MVDTWGGGSNADPFTATDWASFSVLDPLGQKSSGSNMYAMPSLYTYDQRPSSSWGGSYDPAYGRYGTNYDPVSGFTSRIIDSDVQAWMQAEFPELYSFDTGYVNTGGSSGTVARDPGLGAFAQTPGSWDKIQLAADKAGIPANVLLSFVHLESSGDWGRDGNRLWWGRPESGGLLPYIGVFDATLKSRLGDQYSVEQLLGDQQGQLDVAAQILRQMYGEVQQANPNYGWGNVASYYFSGHMNPAVNPWGDEHGNYGGNMGYMTTFQAVLNRADAWTQANGGTLGVMGSTGLGSVDSGDWAPYNQMNAQINQTANATGTAPNFVKAVYRANSTSPALDPDQAVLAISTNFATTGSWEAATKQYALSMGIEPDRYWRDVNSYWMELDASVSGRFGSENGDMGPVTNIEAVWGNKPGVTTTQRNGEVNSWTTGAGSGYYDYSTGVLGYANAHPGNDYGMEYGTQIYTPVGGEVIVVTSGSYNDERQMGVPGTGELRVRLDNGDELIFGHMAGIHVQPGSRVNPGQYVGLSGTAGSGPHLHLEYRTPDAAMSSGWRSVDPEEALRGVFTSSFSGLQTGAGISRPMTFNEMLKASADGSQIFGGLTVGSTNTWNAWLQSAMRGEIPNTRDESMSVMRGNNPQFGDR